MVNLLQEKLIPSFLKVSPKKLGTFSSSPVFKTQLNTQPTYGKIGQWPPCLSFPLFMKDTGKKIAQHYTHCAKKKKMQES